MANSNKEHDSERENAEYDMVHEGIARVEELFPDIGGPEALILMTVLNALGPVLDAQLTPAQRAVGRAGANVASRRKEIRNNPIASVRGYNPKDDTNW